MKLIHCGPASNNTDHHGNRASISLCNGKLVLNAEDKRESKDKEMREKCRQFRGQIDINHKPMISMFFPLPEKFTKTPNMFFEFHEH